MSQMTQIEDKQRTGCVKKKVTRDEWLAEGKRRFGPSIMKWKFVCPCCGHVQSVQDYMDAGAPEGAVSFSCVGRYIESSRRAFQVGAGPGPCDYAGGGLFRLNPVEIDGVCYFDFADAEEVTQ